MLRNLYFNQIILINITIWKRQNSIEIEDFASKTIKSFQNVVFGDDIVTIEDYTPELLLFAQKYFIKPLISKSAKYLGKTLTQENVFGVCKIAHLIDQENLLQKASEFLKQNMEKMLNTEDWKNFEKSHPDCMVRIYRLMFAKKE